MPYLSYKILSCQTQPSEDKYYYDIRKVEYLNHTLSSDDRLIWISDGAEISTVKSHDKENNLASWKQIHKDWENEYENQFDVYEKYLAKKRFLNNVIAEFELWFRSNDVEYPSYISDDYRSINFHGEILSLTAKNASIIRILHKHAKRQTPEVSFASLVTTYEQDTNVKYKNIKDMFSDDNIK